VKPNDASGAINVPLWILLFAQDDRAARASFVQVSPDAIFFHRIVRRDIIERVYRSNPKYRALIQQWRRPPRPVVNGLGPSIVRNLG
jgi:hypothetical protein